MDQNTPKDRKPQSKNDYEQFITTLADPTLKADDLVKAAWRYYRSAGCPYGETRKGLALWLERITGTTAN